MDTTKEYIKMCEKAVEIQDNYTFLIGDFEVMNDVVIIFPTTIKYTGVMPAVKRRVWLPRQDQLQGIVSEYLLVGVPGLIRLFNDFFESLRLEDFPGKFNSMEQLWLAFVMKEKYSKIWNGKDWVK